VLERAEEMKKTYELYSGHDLEVAELILRRRLQMLVHSYLYYDRNTNLIDDRQFDMMGRELVKLQADYPEISKNVEYYEAFKNWDASTGFDLPYRDPRIVSIAERLLNNTGHTVSRPVPVKNEKPKTVKRKPVKSARKSLF
jgi:hypothetical protein